MIKKYGLFVGLLMISVSAFAMEDGLEDPPAPTGWQQAKKVLLWPLRPFEVVDRDDAVRLRYKGEILSHWNDICLEDDPEDWRHLTAKQKMDANYKRYKLEHLRDDDASLPTRNQILIWKYKYLCVYTLWIPIFLHGHPYSYFASGLYYSALGTGAWKGYQRIKKLFKRKEKKHKEQHTNTHPDCAWCKARQKAISAA